jgi:DNA-binding transcriptional ArsR family regulator
MNTNIYHTQNPAWLQSAVREAAEWSEFTYKDDPDYNAFCSAIRQEVEREGIQRFVKDGMELDSVRTNKLYGAWYTSATFRTHWKEPTKQSQNAMLWIVYNRGWSEAQGYVAVIAWWRKHHRKITPEMLEELERLAGLVWDEVQEKKMKKKFEAQRNSLRNRIIAMLRQHPATTAFLAEKLRATSKAVDSHLYRLRRKGLVERLSWGLYAMVTNARSGAKAKPTD